VTGIECAFSGRLGRDAELKHVKDGTLPLLTFTAAVDQQHQTEDSPATWVRVVMFGDEAQELAQRLLKGVKVYVEGKLEASIWHPENGGAARLNLNVTATTVQPIGQIGRRLPTRGQRAHDRSRDAGRARAAGEAIVRELRQPRMPDPPAAWLDDSEAAIRDLVEGPGR